MTVVAFAFALSSGLGACNRTSAKRAALLADAGAHEDAGAEEAPRRSWVVVSGKVSGLTEPIELGALPAVGSEITVTAVGDLTIHGVTRNVSIPLHAALHQGVIAAAGSLTFTWDEFDMERPTAQRVISLADDVTMEAQLFFTEG